jgi:hypothetical protein
MAGYWALNGCKETLRLETIGLIQEPLSGFLFGLIAK